jgi:hypothetical protein
MRLTMLVMALMSTLVISAHGQKLSKEEKKAAKEQAKVQQQEQAAALARRTVDFTMLAKFPKDYVGKSFRVSGVTIDGVSPYSEGGETYYLLAVSNDAERIMAFPLSNQLMLVLPEALARSAVSAMAETAGTGYNKLIDFWVGDVATMDTPRGPIFAGRVACITIPDIRANRRVLYGSCPPL